MKDALNNELIVGKKYIYSQQKRGNTEITIGVLLSQKKSKVLLETESYFYENNISKERFSISYEVGHLVYVYPARLIPYQQN